MFSVANGFVCVWIDCEFAPGFELPAGALPGVESPVLEGDAILF